MKYAIIIEKAENNYSAYSPDVPGCAAAGKTLEEVKQQIQEALEFHFEGYWKTSYLFLNQLLRLSTLKLKSRR